jgi:adenylate cyclase
MRFIGFGPSRLNRRICSGCIRALEKRPGGAEIELSLLFADVRGSTTLAERMPAEEFSQLMARFYGTAAQVVDRRNGIVDKFVGDQAMARTVGVGDTFDFTALGDSVNTAARLAASAGAGEILVSSTAAKALELDTAGLESRTLELRGGAESVQAWVAA